MQMSTSYGKGHLLSFITWILTPCLKWTFNLNGVENRSGNYDVVLVIESYCKNFVALHAIVSEPR